MIKPESIDELREKADIVQVISDYVALKKRGKNYLGLCPFHSEKTASFTVSPDKHLYHCFGCHEGGNLFSFIMRVENVEFAEACEILAEKVGVTLQYSGPRIASTSSSKSQKERAYFALLAAARFYQSHLKLADDYLKERGINEKSQKDFMLGCAVEEWDTLYKYLTGKGFSPVDLEAVGLVKPRENSTGAYDLLRHRLIFPIVDLRGKVAGFSGRALEKDQDPKYLNSPDTLVFNKGSLLYGLNLAKEPIKKLKYAVLVEGNVDVVSCHQAGATNTVAPLGTAFTPEQARLLARFTQEVIIAFDTDSAGISATSRAVELLKNENVLVKVAGLGKHKDPDELIKAEGAKALSDAFRQATGWIEFRLEKLFASHNLSSIEERSKVAHEAAQLIAQENDEMIRSQYLRRVSQKTKIEIEDLRSEIGRLRSQSRYSGQRSNLSRTLTKPTSAEEEAQKKIILALSENPQLVQKLQADFEPADFTLPALREAYEMALRFQAGNVSFLNFLMDNLESEESKKALSEIMLTEGEILDPERTILDCARILMVAKLKRKLSLLKSDLSEAERSQNIELAKSLTVEYNTLFGQLRSFPNISP